jgi:phosphoribosylglycinamide formyltransferase-1
VRSRILVLISGSGTNLEALLHSLPNSRIAADVVAVGSDQEAAGLQHAHQWGIPTFVLGFEKGMNREAWARDLGDAMDTFTPDLIVLSGFMRLLPPSLLARFESRIINTHPSFLPEFPGAHAVRGALDAKVVETGASVIVVDAGVDSGEILAQSRVSVFPGDTEESLHDRIKILERQLLLEVLTTLIPTP